MKHEVGTPISHLAIVAITFVQGLCLYLLIEVLGSDLWLAEQQILLAPLFAIAISYPILLILIATESNWRRTAILGAIPTLIAAACAAYTGWVVEPDLVPAGTIFALLSLTMTIAMFKALLHVQVSANHQKRSYQTIFASCWRNVLTLGMGIVLAIGYGIILLLWGALFDVIGISFFSDLFDENWFIMPTIAVAFGLGISIFRRLEDVIASYTKLLEALFRLLLPLLVVVAIVFAIALPIVGLDALWSTQRGTSLVLWLLALTLFSVNAVYQSGETPTSYSRFVQGLVCIGLMTLPIYSGISFYGLFERITEYGWTVQRCWAMLAWAVLSAFSIGYALGVVRKRLEWNDILPKTNIYLGLALMTALTLANTPLLDFRKISLESQSDRAKTADNGWHSFEFHSARQDFGRHGHELMTSLKSQYPDDLVLVDLIDNPKFFGNVNPGDPLEILTYVNEPFEIPLPVVSILREMRWGDITQIEGLKVDLSRDGIDELVFVFYRGKLFNTAIVVYQLKDQTGWDWQSLNASGDNETPSQDQARTTLVVRPHFDDLRIGGLYLNSMDPFCCDEPSD